MRRAWDGWWLRAPPVGHSLSPNGFQDNVRRLQRCREFRFAIEAVDVPGVDSSARVERCSAARTSGQTWTRALKGSGMRQGVATSSRCCPSVFGSGGKHVMGGRTMGAPQRRTQPDVGGFTARRLEGKPWLGGRGTPRRYEDRRCSGSGRRRGQRFLAAVEAWPGWLGHVTIARPNGRARGALCERFRFHRGKPVDDVGAIAGTQDCRETQNFGRLRRAVFRWISVDDRCRARRDTISSTRRGRQNAWVPRGAAAGGRRAS